MAYSRPELWVQWDPAGLGWTDMTFGDRVLDLGSNARVSIRRGVEYQDGVFVPLVSDVQLRLSNHSGKLTPRGSGALYTGNRLSNTPLRFQLIHTAIHDMWSGYIRRRRRGWERGRLPTMEVTARGLFALIMDEKVTPDFSAGSLDVDGALLAVFEASRNVESGDVSLADSNVLINLIFGDQKPVGEQLMGILLSEMGGMLYEATDGKPTFIPRHSLLGYSLADSTLDTWGAATAVQPVMVEEIDDDADLLTGATLRTTSYQATPTTNIVFHNRGLQFGTADTTLFIAVGQSIGPTLLQPNQQGIISITGGATPTITCDPWVDYRAAANADGTGADRTGGILVTIYQDPDSNQWKYWLQNNGAGDAYIGHLWFRTDTAILADGGQIMGYVANTTPTAVNDTGVGTIAWTTLLGIASSNNLYTLVTLTAGQTSNYLRVRTPMAGTLGSNLVINGMSFSIEMKRGVSTGGDQIVNVAAVKAGTIVAGTTRQFIVDTTEKYITVGGMGDLWGSQWSPEDMTHADFGFAMWVPSAVANDTFSVDHAFATVYYTEFVPYTSKSQEYTRELPLPDGAKGGKTLTRTLPWVSSETPTRDWSEQILRIGRYGPGILRQVYQHNENATMSSMIAAEPGRLIRYTSPTAAGANGDQFDDYFRVLSVAHSIQVGALGVSEVTLMPAYNFRNLDKIAWDDFTRPDAAALGTTPTNRTWTTASGSFAIVSNKARSSAGSGTASLGQFDIQNAAHVVEARFENLASMTVGDIAGIVARYSNTSNYWNLTFVSVFGGTYSLRFQKIAGGVTTSKATRVINILPVMDLRIIMRGNLVSAWVNGQLLFHGDDSANNSNTRVGLYMKSDTTPLVANFYAQALGT